MDVVAVGFWGAFFGSAALSLAAALAAFTSSARRIALTGALAALLSAAYTLVFLGWVPVGSRDALLRLQAHVAIGAAAILGMLLFAMLGSFRGPWRVFNVRLAMAVLAGAVLCAGWVATPMQSLELAVAMGAVVAAAGMVVSIASALHGERAGQLAVMALPCLVVSAAGLDWYAFFPDRTPWQAHAVSAVGAMAYLLCMGAAMWTRYAYLIDVSTVMRQGPNYDPVTRMPSYEATGALVRDAFSGGDGRPRGMIAVSISNLELVEELHGRAAYNHALFVCASRLRKLALPGVEIGRLKDDGFLLLVRNPRDAQQLMDYAGMVLRRLSRPVVLGTGRDAAALDAGGAVWDAQVGVGLLIESPEMAPDLALAGARDISRAAWAFPSRAAWYEEASGKIVELPLAALAG